MRRLGVRDCRHVRPRQNDSGGNDARHDPVHPVAVWSFNGADEPGVPKGAKLEPGPGPPAFGRFPTTNTAFAFTGKTRMLTVRESDLPGRQLRFGHYDAVTLEACVRVQELKDGSYAYLVGKGRGKKAGLPLNQNYALRLHGVKGEARVSFLFASTAADGEPADQHRWTTTKGFTPDDGWHHVAVTYTFGRPERVRGFVDGRAVRGEWDLGGATDRPPVADGDDIAIGGVVNGSAGNAFRGWLDDVTIWHAALADDVLASRYRRRPGAGPVVVAAPAVRKEDLPKGRVRVELCEGDMPGVAWPESLPAPTESYLENAFGFTEVPHKYVDTGVRADRSSPFLFRAAAVVTLPPGRHRILLRGRPSARLAVDGRPFLATPFPAGGGSGHGTIRDPKSYLDLGPDFRFAPPGNGEKWAAFESKGGEHVVVLEAIVGGPLGSGSKAKRRPELGELVVAVSLEGRDTWSLLTPGAKAVPYTDAGWEAYEAERRQHFDEVNAAARASARDRNRTYWEKRAAAAREWLAAAPAVPVPALPQGYPANNPIDHFIGDALRGRWRRRRRRGRGRSITSSTFSRCSKPAATTATRAARPRAGCGSTTAPRRSRAARPTAPPSCPASRTTARFSPACVDR